MKTTTMKLLVAAILLGSGLAQAAYVLQNNGTTNPVTDGTISIISGGGPSGTFTATNLTTSSIPTWSVDAAVLRFTPTAWAPVGYEVLSAKLSLYDFSGTGTMSLYQLNAAANWNTSATYSTYNGTNTWPPGTGGQAYNSQLVSTLKSTAAAPGWVEVDISDIVKSWATGSTNNGILVQSWVGASTGYGSVSAPLIRYYSSRYSTDYSRSPKLMIETTPIPEPAALGLLALGAVCLAQRRR